MISSDDIHTAVSAFAGVMFAEVIVKPVAIRVGRKTLRVIDSRIGDVLPDWLWKHD
jgi:hypothetical protein